MSAPASTPSSASLLPQTGFFDEAPGERSITRLMFAALILTAIFVAVWQVVTSGHMDPPSFLAIAGTASGLKLCAKTIEARGNLSTPPPEANPQAP